MIKMKNLEKVAERIKKAVYNKEKIVLFGDADLDGITSSVMIKEVVEFLGGDSPEVFISDRERWNYGLSREAVSFMKSEAPGILITLDCGISSFEGAEEAKNIGFELIIIDHHKALSNLPEASLILDPMQEGDEYPFKQMANAGVVYKLSQEILGDDFKEKKRRFLELTTLATIADMVPRESDNKKILEEGVPLLEKPDILSLKVLKNIIEDDNPVEKMVSILNITEPKERVNTGYEFLITESEEEAEKEAKKIKEESKKRRQRIDDEEEKLAQKIKEDQVVIFEGGSFSSYLAGALASRIIKRFKRPVFIYTLEDGMARGSVRVTKEEDAVEAMSSCKDCLEAYGGHPQAAGFMVKEEKIDDFKKCLINYFA